MQSAIGALAGLPARDDMLPATATADEPAEIAEREEEGALATVEMPAGGFEQSGGP